MRLDPAEGMQRAFDKLDALAGANIDPNARLPGITMEAARLHAYAALLNAKVAEDSARLLGETMLRAAGRIDSSIAAFTKATDEGTKALVFWTKVMAITTIALLLTGIAQIVVAAVLKKP